MDTSPDLSPVEAARRDLERVDGMLLEARKTLIVRVREQYDTTRTPIADLARQAGVWRSTIYAWLNGPDPSKEGRDPVG